MFDEELDNNYKKQVEINLSATWYDGKEITKEDYIKFIDLILTSFIYDDVRSVEECFEQFYNEMHPELDCKIEDF